SARRRATRSPWEHKNLAARSTVSLGSPSVRCVGDVDGGLIILSDVKGPKIRGPLQCEKGDCERHAQRLHGDAARPAACVRGRDGAERPRPSERERWLRADLAAPPVVPLRPSYCPAGASS